jgi:hypothetical protein
MASKLSPWPTDGGDLVIGGRDSDTPSNQPYLERSGTIARADVTAAAAGRSAAIRWTGASNQDR